MFTQTFVGEGQSGSKHGVMILSVLLEALALCILILIPLVYTQALPGAQLRNLLLAPPPPTAARPAPSAPKTQPRAVQRVLNSKILVAPVVVPKHINPINDVPQPPDGGIVGSMGEPTTDASSGVPPVYSIPVAPPPLQPPKPKPTSEPVRLTSGVSEANLIHKVQPIYPPIARTARIQGIVEFTATISKEGNIENLQLVRGHPLLVNAAREAVLQWKYRPTLLNGRPVEVITDIIVNFTLTQ